MQSVNHVLITGGSGFFGGILKRQLLSKGFRCTNIDLVADSDRHPMLSSIQGDIRDVGLLEKVFAQQKFAAVFHCAAMLAHGAMDDKLLWTSNVDGTRNVAEACRNSGVEKLVFISSNCLWASNLGHAVREDETPAPVEIYGRSKLAGEQLLREYSGNIHIVVLRTPTIIDSGRLGLLAILFEFIHDGKTVWVVGEGANRYQFLYALDLVEACVLAMQYQPEDNGIGQSLATFHVGSDDVPTLREVYEATIQEAGSRSRVRSLPKAPTIAAMELAHALKLSPLGPYHSRMIAEDFLFDTTRIREQLGWRPTLNNGEMLVQAYRYYATNREEIHARTAVSAHSKAASMGVIRLLKWIS